MSTELKLTKTGLKLVFDVSAQPSPRVSGVYPIPEIPVAALPRPILALEKIAQTGRTGIRVTCASDLPGTASAGWALRHIGYQVAGDDMTWDSIPVTAPVNLLFDQALPSATHKFRLERVDAGQTTVYPETTITTPADSASSENLVLNGDSEFGPIEGVAGYLVYDTTVGGTLPPDGRSGSRYVRLTSIDSPLARRNCTGMVPCQPGEVLAFSGFINVKTDGTGTDPIGVLLEFFDAAGEALYPDGTHVGSDDSYKHYGTTLPSGASHDPWYPVGGVATAPPNAVGCVMFMDYPGGGVYRYDDLSLTRQVQVSAKLPSAAAQNRTLPDKIQDTQTSHDFVLPIDLDRVRNVIVGSTAANVHTQLQEFLDDQGGLRQLVDGIYGSDETLMIDYSAFGPGDIQLGTTNKRVQVEGASMVGTKIYYHGAPGTYAMQFLGGAGDGQGSNSGDIHGGFSLRDGDGVTNDTGTRSGIYMKNRAFSKFRDMNIGGFDTGLWVDACLDTQFNNVSADYNKIGMVVANTAGTFSNVNASSWSDGSFSHNSQAGIFCNLIGSGNVFKNIRIEGNGARTQAGVTSLMGGFLGNVSGGNGRATLGFDGLYAEGNSGPSDMYFENPGPEWITITFRISNFHRLSMDPRTDTCVHFHGKIRAVFISCGFLTGLSFVPSSSRPFIKCTGGAVAYGLGNAYEDVDGGTTSRDASDITDLDQGQFSSQIKAMAGILLQGNTAAQGAIGVDAGSGTVMFGKVGTTYDFSLLNPFNAAYYMRVPTGTLKPEFPSGIAAGVTLNTVTAGSGTIGLTATAGMTQWGAVGSSYDWGVLNPTNTAYYITVPTGTVIPNFPNGLTTTNGTASTSTTTGAAVVGGGLGVGGSIYAGGSVNSAGIIGANAGVALGTATYAQGRIGITASTGFSIWTKTGSSFDFAIADPTNSYRIMELATGTTVLNFPQGLKTSGYLITGPGTVAPPANSGSGSAGTPNGKYANETHYHPASGGGNAITMSYATLCGGPAISISETGGNYTTGSEFYLAAAATCTGIRFVGAAGRTYTLKLWSATGTLLASTTATPGATGVYSGTFAGVALNAGTKYYVSIYNAGYYVQTVLAAPFALAFPLLLAPICLLNPRMYSAGDFAPSTPTTGTTYPVEPILA